MIKARAGRWSPPTNQHARRLDIVVNGGHRHGFVRRHVGMIGRAASDDQDDEPDRTLWRLVCARTLLASPLHDPGGELRPFVAEELRELGRQTPGGYRDYFDEAERYERPRA